MKQVLNLRTSLHKEISEEIPAVKEVDSPVLDVALITIANGGDNIAIYVPLFVPLSWSARLWVVIILLLMVGLWCWISRYLSNHPVIAKLINRYGHVAAPIILILLGAYILAESQSFI